MRLAPLLLGVAVALALVLPQAFAIKYDMVELPDGSLEMRSETQHALRGLRGSDVVAIGEYNDTMMQTGWDTMSVTTNGAFSDLKQAYAAGYFEGLHTGGKAYNHFLNTFPPSQPVTKAAEAFLEKNMAWVDAQLASPPTGGSVPEHYWAHIALVWRQFQGLHAGMLASPGPNMTMAQLYTLAATGDLFDIMPAVDPTTRKNTTNMTPAEFDMFFARSTHCSSLFKVTEDLQEVFFGHASWNEMTTMNRIFKHYTLNFNAAGTTAKTISMSSYPGFLSSFDDFYLTDSGLNVIETSLGVYNMTMYEGNVRPDLLLYWFRVIVSTRMAATAPEWASMVAYKNSGTYNNQWMILNLNLFTPGQPLVPDLMWVAEQMPGVVKSQDVTPLLKYGYYPSYNVPMNRELFVQGGYVQQVEQFGPNMASYQECVRARIFRRDQTKVSDLESYKHIMQYNDFEQDPISNGNPLYAIASRADLNPTAPQCFGAIDTKVSSYSMWKAGQTVHAHSGPTPQQPTFGFNTTWAQCTRHGGIPEMYQFGWEVMSPAGSQ